MYNSAAWAFRLSGGNNTVIYSSAREWLVYMNGPGLCDTLSAQSENRSGCMNAQMKNKGFLLSNGERLETTKFDNSINFDMPYFFFYFFQFFLFLFHSCVFLFLLFFPVCFLVRPLNSSLWWTVCTIWKDRPFIKLLLSIKKMKCSPGPHHLEPSSPPSITLFVTLVQSSHSVHSMTCCFSQSLSYNFFPDI